MPSAGCSTLGLAGLLGLGPLSPVGANGRRITTPEAAARELESLFIGQLLAAMRRTVGDGGLLPSNPGRDEYAGLFDLALARVVSTGRGIGLADLVLRGMARGPRVAEGAYRPAVSRLLDGTPHRPPAVVGGAHWGEKVEVIRHGPQPIDPETFLALDSREAWG